MLHCAGPAHRGRCLITARDRCVNARSHWGCCCCLHVCVCCLSCVPACCWCISGSHDCSVTVASPRWLQGVRQSHHHPVYLDDIVLPVSQKPLRCVHLVELCVAQGVCLLCTVGGPARGLLWHPRGQGCCTSWALGIHVAVQVSLRCCSTLFSMLRAPAHYFVTITGRLQLLPAIAIRCLCASHAWPRCSCMWCQASRLGARSHTVESWR